MPRRAEAVFVSCQECEQAGVVRYSGQVLCARCYLAALGERDPEPFGIRRR
jgi:uncharacterized membrane protein